jgi:methenyltetrahydrofolate cyclohydrolase
VHLESSISSFLDVLASKASSPGGGSVAALNGALGAGLLSMVCNLTLGKEKYRAVEEQVKQLLAESERLRKELEQQIEADAAVLGELMIAWGLPRTTDEEKAKRSALLEERAKLATEVPLRVARACAAVMALSVQAAEVGSSMAISDVGVAVVCAEAGLRSAYLNVKINLPLIKDQVFVRRVQEELESLLAGKAELTEQVFSKVEAKL